MPRLQLHGCEPTVYRSKPAQRHRVALGWSRAEFQAQGAAPTVRACSISSDVRNDCFHASSQDLEGAARAAMACCINVNDILFFFFECGFFIQGELMALSEQFWSILSIWFLVMHAK